MRTKDILKEEAIHQQAVAMIVAEGFGGFSMQKLARAAGISPATIYIYFKNKEDLLSALFKKIAQQFEADALLGFNAQMSFEEGLWIQWKNRYKNIAKNPVAFRFFEQFRTSPLLSAASPIDTEFRKQMQLFVKNAMSTGEIRTLPPEILWALSYGPFYILINFHLDQATMAGKPFFLSEQKLKQAFHLVLKALKP